MQAGATKRAALLLDRDGVINVDHDYVYRVADFEWQSGIFELTRAAMARGLLLVVVTNQSGIGRGYYTEADFLAVTAYMRKRFEAEGTPIAAVYHCPFHPEAIHAELRAPDHPWRKPRPGMILAARDDLDLDLERSILIGDRLSDIEAGRAAGVGRVVLVGNRVPFDATDLPREVIRFNQVADVVPWLASLA